MIFNPDGKDNLLMTDSKVIYRYLHGGAGTVTLANPNTWKAHSYAFLKPVNERDFPEDTIFVYVIHDNRRIYLGLLSGSEFRLTAKSTFGEDTEAVKGARYIVKMANRQDLVDKRLMNLYHSGKCCICGRPLSGNKSLDSGIGKKCTCYYNARLEKVPWDGN